MHNDLVPLAVIVFIASIVLPLVKLFGLTWMLIATRVESSRFLVSRTRLYRTIDAIGRWSNIDIFSVAMLVAVLQFGALTAVHAGAGPGGLRRGGDHHDAGDCWCLIRGSCGMRSREPLRSVND